MSARIAFPSEEINAGSELLDIISDMNRLQNIQFASEDKTNSKNITTPGNRNGAIMIQPVNMSQKPRALKEDQPHDRETRTGQIEIAPSTVEDPTTVSHAGQKSFHNERSIAETFLQLDAFYEQSAAGKIVLPDELLEFVARLKGRKFKVEKETTKKSPHKAQTNGQQTYLENQVADLKMMKHNFAREMQKRCERVQDIE